MGKKKYAVVDFGTNSARLMIAERNNDGITVLSKEMDTIRLGDGMSEGIITSGAMERAKNTVIRFIKAAVEAKTDEFFCFATSAVRDAENTKGFINYIAENCGVQADVISGDEEAEIGYLGATYSRGGKIGLIDIGGGSTEIILGKEKQIDYAESFPVGIVRMLQKFPSASPENLYEYDRCSDYIKNLFKNLPAGIKSKKWLGIGGTATSLASIDLKLKAYDRELVEGHHISLGTLADIVNSMKNQTVGERKKIIGLDEKRADVIVFGGIIMLELLKILGADGYTASESDNLEGYLLRKLGMG